MATIKTTDKPPIRNTETAEAIEQRKKDIHDVIDMSKGACLVFTSGNIKSWKAAFYKLLRDKKLENKYTFKDEGNNIYKVWRIE